MNLGSGQTLQSLYMLRDNSGQAGQLSPNVRVGSGYGFSHAELAASRVQPTPGSRRREPAIGGRSAQPAGIFHLGSLGSVPRIRALEAGQLNPSAFAFAAISPDEATAGPPGIGGTPYPSFGATNPNAPPAPGSPDNAVSQGSPGLGVVTHVAPPPMQLAPPMQTPPSPGGGGTTPPQTSSNLPWLIGGGVILAFMFFGTDKKKRRKRA